MLAIAPQRPPTLEGKEVVLVSRQSLCHVARPSNLVLD